MPNRYPRTRIIVYVFAFLLLCFFFASSVKAAGLSTSMVRLDRVKAGSTTTGTVCIKPPVGNSSTEASVQITFPAGFTLGTAASFTTSTTNLSWPAGAIAWVGIGNTATSVGSQIVTLASGALAANTLYCFNWTTASAVTNPAINDNLTGTIVTRDAGTATIDSGPYALSIITDDQVVVSATVPATFSFSLTSNSSSIGVLSPGSVGAGSSIGCVFSTNAANGVIGWVVSANAALVSAGSGGSITSVGTSNSSPETLSAGTSGYVLDANTNTNGTGGTGTVTIDAEYDGGANGGGHLATTLQTLFTTSGTHANGRIDLVPRAAISATQVAGNDYSDTLTVVAAGRF